MSRRLPLRLVQVQLHVKEKEYPLVVGTALIWQQQEDLERRQQDWWVWIWKQRRRL